MTNTAAFARFSMFQNKIERNRFMESIEITRPQRNNKIIMTKIDVKETRWKLFGEADEIETHFSQTKCERPKIRFKFIFFHCLHSSVLCVRMCIRHCMCKWQSSFVFCWSAFSPCFCCYFCLSFRFRIAQSERGSERIITDSIFIHSLVHIFTKIHNRLASSTTTLSSSTFSMLDARWSCSNVH